jgi:hypothetical protein
VGGGVANVSVAYVDLAKAELEYNVVSAQRKAISKVEDVRARCERRAGGDDSREGGGLHLRGLARSPIRSPSLLPSSGPAHSTATAPLRPLPTPPCSHAPGRLQAVDAVKAVPSNLRKSIEQKAQDTATSIQNLPAELKQRAATAAEDAASSLKQRAASRTTELYGSSEPQE